MSWEEFLGAHWDVMAATDFFTTEVWTMQGLVRYHVLFVIRLATREVKVVGITPEPNGEWMKQMARNRVDCETGFLLGYKYLIQDRGMAFTKDFRKHLDDSGVRSIRLPRKSPDLKCYAERWVRSTRVCSKKPQRSQSQIAAKVTKAKKREASFSNRVAMARFSLMR
jgi:hypothetical protein